MITQYLCDEIPPEHVSYPFATILQNKHPGYSEKKVI